MTNQDQNAQELSRCRDAAYRYLSYRPRSRTEVTQKLKDKGFSQAAAAAVMADLDRLGYVNDREFALLWSRSRIRLRGFGKRRIEQELREKGVSRELIQAALSESFDDSSELELALREAGKKMRSLARFEPETQRRRIAGLLERRGFPSGVIHSVLKQLLNT